MGFKWVRQLAIIQEKSDKLRFDGIKDVKFLLFL